MWDIVLKLEPQADRLVLIQMKRIGCIVMALNEHTEAHGLSQLDHSPLGTVNLNTD